MYTVVAHPEGSLWEIRIPALDGVNGFGEAITQAESKDTIATEATDYIATVLDCDTDSVKVDVTFSAGN